MNSKNKILITGSCGFIGFHLSEKLLSLGYQIIGIDNFNDYYEVNLKINRYNILNKYKNFIFYKNNLEDKENILNIFLNETPDYVINLAAQAGVRYSLINPSAYIDSNIIGFLSILESCRLTKVKHLIFASSSSVYGGNIKVPFSTNDNTDHPVSIYAATKKSNELMAHTYSHLYGLPVSGLRFFTVYGPFGRPDMAYYTFTKNIFEGKSINIFNNGNLERDFTYVDDIVESIIRLIDKIPNKNLLYDEITDGISSSYAPYKIFNIGNNNPVKLMTFISVLENLIGRKAKKTFMEMQPGDVLKTYADVSDLEKIIGYSPSTSLEYGLNNFVSWYKEYYKI